MAQITREHKRMAATIRLMMRAAKRLEPCEKDLEKILAERFPGRIFEGLDEGYGDLNEIANTLAWAERRSPT